LAIVSSKSQRILCWKIDRAATDRPGSITTAR
jgi:hypothetical protein